MVILKINDPDNKVSTEIRTVLSWSGIRKDHLFPQDVDSESCELNSPERNEAHYKHKPSE